jgi:hypothetical protein
VYMCASCTRWRELSGNMYNFLMTHAFFYRIRWSLLRECHAVLDFRVSPIVALGVFSVLPVCSGLPASCVCVCFFFCLFYIHLSCFRSTLYKVFWYTFLKLRLNYLHKTYVMELYPYHTQIL